MFKTLLSLVSPRNGRSTQRKPPTARLQVEALENRLVPAYAAPIYQITGDMAKELKRGEDYLSHHNYEEAWSSFQNVERQAYDCRDAAKELKLADDYRRLGAATQGLRDFRHNAFASEQQAYSNAVGHAAFWTFYGAERDSGSYRAYGIERLAECAGAYANLIEGMPAAAVGTMTEIRIGAEAKLNEANHQQVLHWYGSGSGVIDGTWVTDDGHSIKFSHGYVTVYSPATHTSTTGSSVIPVPDVVQAGGAWNVATGTFTITGWSLRDGGQSASLTFTFDPRKSGRMQVEDAHGKFEVYRSWDTKQTSTGATPWSTDPVIDRLARSLVKMTAADAAKELWKQEGGNYKYTWDQRIGALQLLGSTYAAQVILSFPTVQDRANALTRLMPDSTEFAANVAWELGTWPETIAVFDKMDAKNVAQLVWVGGSDKTLDALRQMTPQRTAEVIYNFKTWGDVKTTLKMMYQRDAQWPFQVLNAMPADRVARFVLSCYQTAKDRAGVLAGLTAKQAALTISKFDSWKLKTDVLAQMSTKRAAEVVYNFNIWSDVQSTLQEMYKVNSQWPYQVLREWSVDRLAGLIANCYYNNPNAVLKGLTPGQVSQVLQKNTLQYRVFALNGMTPQRAADVLIQYDPSLMKTLLNGMPAARRQAILQALGR